MNSVQVSLCKHPRAVSVRSAYSRHPATLPHHHAPAGCPFNHLKEPLLCLFVLRDIDEGDQRAPAAFKRNRTPTDLDRHFRSVFPLATNLTTFGEPALVNRIPSSVSVSIVSAKSSARPHPHNFSAFEFTGIIRLLPSITIKAIAENSNRNRQRPLLLAVDRCALREL